MWVDENKLRPVARLPGLQSRKRFFFSSQFVLLPLSMWLRKLHWLPHTTAKRFFSQYPSLCMNSAQQPVAAKAFFWTTVLVPSRSRSQNSTYRGGHQTLGPSTLQFRPFPQLLLAFRFRFLFSNWRTGWQDLVDQGPSSASSASSPIP